jgi:uncharacterized membrane protein
VGALLLGLYGMPLVLLALGHGLRRRPPRLQRAFWGAVVGHLVALLLAMAAALATPAMWTGDDTVRGLLGLWTLLLLPLGGALLGALAGRHAPGAGPSPSGTR